VAFSKLRAIRSVRLAGASVEAPPPEFFTVHAADARGLAGLLAGFSSPEAPLLTTTITSPPYGDLKDYGHQRQIGRGQRHDEYLMDMRRVFDDLFAHTRLDGSLWVIADTLRPRRSASVRRLVPLPFELAQQAEIAGWVLRDVIIWHKDKTLPWSSPGRLRNSFEYVLFFVKSAHFKYRIERLREPDDLKQWWVRYPERYNPEGKAPTNVWYAPIPVQGSWANTAVQHACPLPPDLVERMILLSTDETDVVFDPFAGSGVVVAEAERLRRRGLGSELVEAHVAAFQDTVRAEVTQRRGLDVLAARAAQSAALRETILSLRAVKYPRVLMDAVSKGTDRRYPIAALVFRRGLPKARSKHQLVAADVHFIVEGDAKGYLKDVRAASARRPASKFGVSGDLYTHSIDEVGRLMRGRKLFGYANGKTHLTIGRVTAATVRSSEHSVDRIPLIVSNVELNETPRAVQPAESPDRQVSALVDVAQLSMNQL
jgi:DNA modification methylase